MKKTQTILKENAKNFIKKGLHKVGVKGFFKKFE